MTIEKNATAVTITIADNGRGFDKNAAPPSDAESGGFGLLGVTERVLMLGEVLEIESATERARN